jgi:hypothetical protein
VPGYDGLLPCQELCFGLLQCPQWLPCPCGKMMQRLCLQNAAADVRGGEVEEKPMERRFICLVTQL